MGHAFHTTLLRSSDAWAKIRVHPTRICCSHVRRHSDPRLNIAQIHACLESEVASIAPSCAPAVHEIPEIDPILDSIAHQCNCMAASLAARAIGIYITTTKIEIEETVHNAKR